MYFRLRGKIEHLFLKKKNLFQLSIQHIKNKKQNKIQITLTNIQIQIQTPKIKYEKKQKKNMKNS